jgi:hypothetical protein
MGIFLAMVMLTPGQTNIMTKFAKMTPTYQRLSIGATGLFMQTYIDYHNKNVDEETRKYSAVRTAVKMIVTTAGGVTFREIGQRFGQWLVNTGKMPLSETILKECEILAKKSPTALKREYADIVGKSVDKLTKTPTAKDLATKIFANKVGMCTAVIVAAISVFIWDMPFVNKIMNFTLKKLYGDKATQNSSH